MEAQVVRQAQRGELLAQEQLLEACRQRIFALAFHMIGSATEAEEIAQEALLKIFLHLQDLRDPSRFWPWATRVACNLFRDELRRRKQLPTLPLLDLDLISVGDEAIRGALSTDARARLERLVQRLSPPLRLVLALRDMEGFSTEEVCEALDLPEGTVKSRLFEARRKLRESLARQGVTASHDMC